MARGGGKTRPGGPIPREVLVSKKLSWLLRHGAEKEGLKLGKAGYANLADVKLANRNLKSIGTPTLDEIRTLVADNDKQRFTLIHISQQPGPGSEAPSTCDSNSIQKDIDPRNYLIRANQGHSLKVEDDGLLTAVTLENGNLPHIVVHGTRREYWPLILSSGGLKKMTRNHVHFATGVPASLQSSLTDGNEAAMPNAEVERLSLTEQPPPAVISGMRLSSTILIFLNLRLAMEKGLKFFLSDNGVILSEGDERGLVGVELFLRVEEKGGKVLMKDGEVVGEFDPKSRQQRSNNAERGGRAFRGKASKAPQLNDNDL